MHTGTLKTTYKLKRLEQFIKRLANEVDSSPATKGGCSNQLRKIASGWSYNQWKGLGLVTIWSKERAQCYTAEHSYIYEYIGLGRATHTYSMLTQQASLIA